MSSDSFSSSEEATCLRKSQKKKPKYSSNYKIEWEKDIRFRNWIKASGKGKQFFYCSYCKCDISNGNKGIGDVIRHMNCQKHQLVTKDMKGTLPLKNLPVLAKKSKLNDQVKSAEVRFSAFVAEHNLPFTISDHATELFKAMFPDSQIASNFKCKRTKTTALVNSVLSKSSNQNLNLILKNQKFSLIIDESTDIGITKSLCLVVRYYDLIRQEVCDRFLSLISLEKSDHTEIYRQVTDTFEKKGIPFRTNLVGFAADGASTMFGRHNSVNVLLKNDVPNLFSITCVCHSFALCASKACKELPRFLEDLVRDVYNYFKNSAKRYAGLKMYQEICSIKPHKILCLGQTRWLSLEAVIKRILEQFEPLNLFFENAAKSDKLVAAEKIVMWLKDPQVKVFLEFLNYILPYFNKLNRLFQTESCVIHILYEQVLDLYKTIISSYIKPQYLESADSLNPAHPHLFLPLKEIYLGVNAQIALQNVKNSEIETFIRTRCLNFLVTAAKSMKEKFNFTKSEESQIKNISALNPNNVFNNQSLQELLKYYSFLTPDQLQLIDSEYRQLANDKSLLNCEDNFETFWTNVSKIKCGNDLKYKNICSFIKDYILTLPHSSANVERVFSIISINKTKSRNRLGSETLNGVLHTKALLKNQSCFNFDVSNNILRFFDTHMYNFVDEKEKPHGS